MMKMVILLLALHGLDRIECSALPHGPKLRLRIRIRIESENERWNQSQESAVAIRPIQASFASCQGEAFGR